MNNVFKNNKYLFIAILSLISATAFALFVAYSFGVIDETRSTRVGTIYLGGHDESEYAIVLDGAVSSWQEQAQLFVEFQNHSFQIDLTLFTFDLEETIEQMVGNETNNAYFLFTQQKQEELENELVMQFGQDIMDLVDIEQLKETILLDLQSFKKIVNYDLGDFMTDEMTDNVLNETHISGLNPADVTAIANSILVIEIKGNSRFSLLTELQNSNLSNEQMSIIASGIQNITAKTTFTGFVFEQHEILPSWAKSGSDVRILLVNNFDFAFFNNLELSYTIEIYKMSETELRFRLLGMPFVYSITVEAVTITDTQYQNIYTNNINLDQNTPNIIITETDYEYTYRLLINEGSLGRIIAFIRTTIDPNGNIVTTRLYFEQIAPINAHYEENIVPKEG